MRDALREGEAQTPDSVLTRDWNSPSRGRSGLRRTTSRSEPDGQGNPRHQRLLAGGVVAYNEESRIELAVRSLLDQELPEGVGWSRIWVVASGCTDRTVAVARAMAAQDPRVLVIEETERGGKAQALGEVFRHAQGDALVLLNSDAQAADGAVRELLRASYGQPAPYAVMGRPVVPPDLPGRWTRAVRMMWSLHHHFHDFLAADGGGAHLSDELLLVSLNPHPPLPVGIINDGSYFGVWLAQHGGRRLYAPEAQVRIAAPFDLRDHLHQRRRIAVGNGQVARLLGEPPSTFATFALRKPGSTARLLWRSVLSEPSGVRRFLMLGVAEAAATALAYWDRVPPVRDHVRWQRIREPPLATPPGRSSTRSMPEPHEFSVASLERRIATLVDVAARFRTSISLPDLVPLLPSGAPATVSAARGWLEQHPAVALLDGDQVLAPLSAVEARAERRARGERFHECAELLLGTTLRRTHPWIRCATMTGSGAYGEPGAEDDLDLLVVTRTGALWWFLAYTFLAVRLERMRSGKRPGPRPCFNFVLEDRGAEAAFAQRKDFLAAREALSARTILGARYYQGLLARSSWMEALIPRLYAEVARGPVDTTPRPAPGLVRLASALVFPWLAAYLQLTGLARGWAFRRRAEDSKQFRTVTRRRQFAVVSERFEHLRLRYETERETTEDTPRRTYSSSPPSPR